MSPSLTVKMMYLWMILWIHADVCCVVHPSVWAAGDQVAEAVHSDQSGGFEAAGAWLAGSGHTPCVFSRDGGVCVYMWWFADVCCIVHSSVWAAGDQVTQAVHSDQSGGITAAGAWLASSTRSAEGQLLPSRLWPGIRLCTSLELVATSDYSSAEFYYYH